MGERKVLNKYYPIDFETYKLPKLKLPKDRQYVVRLMSPFTMRCLTCGEYIYHGRKFNARKETVQNEDYLGIPIHRFYIRCTRCLSEITFKTDPKNTDYVAEHGAVRTFQAHRVLEKQEEERKREKEEQEANDPMLALENRTRDSRREMDVLDALEDIKDQNARFEQVDLNALLKKYEEEERRQLQRQEEEDEALVESIFRKNDGTKRLQDDGEEESERKLNARAGTKRPPTDVLVGEGTQDSGSSNAEKKKGKTSKGALLGIVKRTSKSTSGSSQVGEDRCGEDAPTEEDKTKDSVKVGDISTPHSCDGRIEDKDKGSNSGLGLIGAYSDTDSDST